MGVLRAGLARFAGWRLRTMTGGRLPKRLVIDIDSLPLEVNGGQPGSEWNGHYHARIYHPLIASAGCGTEKRPFHVLRKPAIPFAPDTVP